MTPGQFIVETANLPTPAEFVARCGQAMSSRQMALMLDVIITEARSHDQDHPVPLYDQAGKR